MSNLYTEVMYILVTVNMLLINRNPTYICKKKGNNCLKSDNEKDIPFF